jgi:hypothetical protein
MDITRSATRHEADRVVFDRGHIRMAIHIGPNRHVAASIHDGGVVLLHTTHGRLFTANHIGARIWHALERARPLHDIAAEISRHYRIPTDTAADHVDRFVAQLEHQRLVARRAGR